ncbi:MAG TPA: hypothetical protein VK586_16915 [Streptosporangiaceae bacterium]|nr:hypothetical protein [Streptosporangiaceae bacterium]
MAAGRSNRAGCARTPQRPSGDGRLRSLAAIVVLDVAAPLAAYSLLRSAGLPAVTALALSGIFPAAAVIASAIRKRRLDVIGTLVLAGIVAGAMAGRVTGPETAKGHEMTTLWGDAGFRRVFRIITVVWGAGFLAEAVLRVVIVYNTSTGTALAISKVMPFICAAVLPAWTVGFGASQRRKGERMAAAAADVRAGSPEMTR